MNIPTFYPGETLSAEKLNRLAGALRELAAECRANRITDVSGGTFERNTHGTTITFPPLPKRRAAPQAGEYVHPFKVSLTDDGKIHVATGTVYCTNVYKSESDAGFGIECLGTHGGGFLEEKAVEGLHVCLEFNGAEPARLVARPYGRVMYNDVLIATIIDYNGGKTLRVAQALRSDIFLANHSG